MPDIDHRQDLQCINQIQSLQEAQLLLQELLLQNKISRNDIENSLQSIQKQAQEIPKTAETKSDDKLNKHSSCTRASKNLNPVHSVKILQSNEDRNKEAISTKKQKLESMHNFRTRPIALLLAYHGQAHSGFTSATKDPNENDNSVEYYIFQALQKSKFILNRSSCKYSRCGRTDKGVSANGQVISLLVRSAIPAEITEDNLPTNAFEHVKILNNTKVYQELNYPKILNYHLPSTIRVLGWSKVSTTFSARFNTTHRQYRYYFRINRMNVSNMELGLNHLIGTHDFRNFCKYNVKEVQQFQRHIYEAKIYPSSECSISDEIGFFQISGSAFLHHQIRCIVFLLFLIGKELENPDLISTLLNIDHNPCKPNYSLASDLPLVLHSCHYDNDDILSFSYSVENLWNISLLWKQKLEEIMLEARKIKDGIDSLHEEKFVQMGDVRVYLLQILTKRQEKIKRMVNKKKHSLKWLEKYPIKLNVVDFIPSHLQELDDRDNIKWKDAMTILSSVMEQEENLNHVPIMERVKGLSFEDKLRAWNKISKK